MWAFFGTQYRLNFVQKQQFHISRIYKSLTYYNTLTDEIISECLFLLIFFINFLLDDEVTYLSTIIITAWCYNLKFCLIASWRAVTVVGWTSRCGKTVKVWDWYSYNRDCCSSSCGSRVSVRGCGGDPGRNPPTGVERQRLVGVRTKPSKISALFVIWQFQLKVCT